MKVLLAQVVPLGVLPAVSEKLQCRRCSKQGFCVLADNSSGAKSDMDMAYERARVQLAPEDGAGSPAVAKVGLLCCSLRAQPALPFLSFPASFCLEPIQSSPCLQTLPLQLCVSWVFGFTESPNGLGVKGPLKPSWFYPLPWPGTPSSTPSNLP